jgi:hypothetical protein
MGKRGRPCPLCTPELREKTNALIAAGVSFAEIAAFIGSNKYAVSRHKKHAFPTPTDPPEPLDELAESDQRLATLSVELSAQYQAAITVADSKNALEIQKVRSRVEVERHKRIVSKQQNAVETSANDGKQSIEFSDALIARVAEYERKSGICACCHQPLPTQEARNA